jgi:hypothetical protein
MKLSEVKQHLATAESVNFQLANGTFVPEHFHVTEVGLITRHFIDCGGWSASRRLLTSNYGMQMTSNIV